MSKIHDFNGILIMLLTRGEFDSRHRPHVHAKYNGKAASIDIRTGEVIIASQRFPAKQLKRAREWVMANQDRCMAEWNDAAEKLLAPRRNPIAKKRTTEIVRTRPFRYEDYPLITLVEWLGKADVRLFFSNGKIAEVTLPWVKSAKGVKIVEDGMGIDPGDGIDISGLTLSHTSWIRNEGRGRVLAPMDR